MESAREARRRKILERGTDRIALITAGQTGSDTPSTPQAYQRKHNDVGAPDESSNSNFTIAARGETAPRIKENIKPNVVTTKDSIEEVQAKKEGNAPPRSINPPNPTKNKKEKGTIDINPWIFTPPEISQSFSDTEIIRPVFVVLFAFLVIKGFISSRPMLILLLTDIVLVVGFLILNKGDDKKHKKKIYKMPVDKLGIIIEVGFLAQKVFGAIFMDFCIYAVIVICAMGV